MEASRKSKFIKFNFCLILLFAGVMLSCEKNEDTKVEEEIPISVLDYYKVIDKNNVWIDQYYEDGGIYIRVTSRKLYFNGEEIINGKTYSNLYNRIIDYSYSAPEISIKNSSVREENLLYKMREDEATKRVYILNNENNEVLLYDFSLEVNDVIDLWDTKMNKYISQTVTSVEDILLLNGETRKKINFESDYSIIEGIGYGNVERYFRLTCFYKDTTILYTPNNDCDGSFWDKGDLPSVNLEDSYLVDKVLISRSNLLGDGGNYIENNILEKGICWSSTSQSPTVDDNYTDIYSNEAKGFDYNEVSSLKDFYTSVSNSELQPNTDYYFRSYSKNANGISYSESSYTMNSGFLTSYLTTTLISREVVNDRIQFHLKGNLTENNFPSGATIVEKGFASIHRIFPELKPQSPRGSSLTPVSDGTLDNFEHTINISSGNTDYLNSYFWSYVKFDSGLIVYGNELIE